MARRRPARFVEPLLLDLLERSDRPLTARMLADQLDHRGVKVFPCQILRGLEGLLERKAVTRVELGKGYLAADDTHRVKLVCLTCDRVQLIIVPNVHPTLDRLAKTIDFRSGRYIVEVAGYCKGCGAGRSDTA